MKYLAFLLLVFSSLAAPAVAQSLDPTFQPTTLLNRSANVQVLALAAQADGKTLVAGDFQVQGAALSNNVLRLNPDRSRDFSFRPASGANGPVSSLLVQADGKVLIAGSFTAYAGTATGPVARLLPSGELDPTFQLPAALGGAPVRALALQADGKLLVGGAAGAALPGGLVRLLPGGALDASFGVGLGAGSGGQVLTLAVQPADGRVVVGGQFASFGGRACQSLVRLLPTGQPDADFAASSFATGAVVNSVALYASGNVLVGGYTSSGGLALTALVARLLPTGAPDPQLTVRFGPYGVVQRVRALADNRMLVGGNFQYYATAPADGRTSLVQLLADGSVDPSFVPPYSYHIPTYCDLLPLPGGQLLAGGQLASRPYGLSVLSADGSPVAGFELDLQWRGSVGQAVPLLNGQIAISGSYTSLNGQGVSSPAQRLSADGRFAQNVLPYFPDPLSLLPKLYTQSYSYDHVYMQPDGQAYVVAALSGCQNYPCGLAEGRPATVKLFYHVRADNTLDPDFKPVSLSTIVGLSLAPLFIAQYALPYATGDVLLAGLVNTRTITTSSFSPKLIRYLPTGAVAPGFTSPDLLVGSLLDQVLMQADGKVLVSYHLASGESKLVRLLADGSLDPNFTIGSGPALPVGSAFTAALLQPDGKLLVRGTFTSSGGVATPSGVVRLTSSGAVDASFQPPASLAPVVPLAALPDGRLLVRVNSQTGLARLRQLLADGTPDPTFAPVAVMAAGYPVSSWNVVLQPGDGKPVLYGDFDSAAGQPRLGLARLGTATPLASRSAGGAAAPLSFYPNPARQRATLVLPAALPQTGIIQLYDALGREVWRQAAPAHQQELPISLAGLRPGLYLLRCGEAAGRLVVD